jgi:dipeptidyl aminopeptidase/acylaminoacyl peptidase
VEVAEPPYWINNSLLAFASGDPFDLLNPQRRLWLANVDAGTASEVRPQGIPESASVLSEAWSPDGQQLFAQVADQVNQLLFMTREGRPLRRESDLEFPRYGMSAHWSPDGQRLAIGGSAGQCPYGVRVKAADFRNLATGAPPPSMCDPVFSPDSRHIAFSGVNPRVDGRNDIFIANSNGFGAINLTGNLRGQVELLGWVGGSP